MNLFIKYHIYSLSSLQGMQEKIPFVKAAPIEELETKKAKKQKDGMKKKNEGAAGDAVAKDVAGLKLDK